MADSPRDLSPRKSLDDGSVKSKTTRRPKKDKSSRHPTKLMPFMVEDDICDVTIKMNDKLLYTSTCLLAYNSPVLDKHLRESAAPTGKGRGKPGTIPSSKDLDLSDSKHTYEDVVALLCIIDPREEKYLTAEDAMRVLPMVDEYEMNQVRRQCERTLTKTYRKMRKGRRPGMIPTHVTLEYLCCADKYEFEDLKKMSIEECVANDNPYGNQAISDMKDLSGNVKVQVLNKKLDKVNMQLARERRLKSEKEDDNTPKKKTTKSWQI